MPCDKIRMSCIAFFKEGCCDIEKISNIDIEKISNIDIEKISNIDVEKKYQYHHIDISISIFFRSSQSQC